MNEEVLYRWLMISAAVIAVLCGLGAVALLVLCAITWSWGVLLCSILMAAGAIGAGFVTVMFSTKTTAPKVFNKQDEKEVLTMKQRKELRKARGERVIEKEKTDADNPELPPYATRWSNVSDKVKQIRGPHRFPDDEEYER